MKLNNNAKLTSSCLTICTIDTILKTCFVRHYPHLQNFEVTLE